MMGKTVAIQAPGYLLLLVLIYAWFGIADRSVWQVLLSGVLAVAIVCAMVWLIAQALAVPLKKALPWVVVIVAAVCGCAWLAARVKPAYAALPWIAAAVLVLGLLPPATGSAGALRRWNYWIAAAGLAAAGVLLPWLLVRWVPKLQGFGAQTASMAIRFGLAYAIALAAWLIIASLPRRIRYAS